MFLLRNTAGIAGLKSRKKRRNKSLELLYLILNIIISVSLFGRFGFVIIPIATSISSWINVLMHYYFIKKGDLHNFDNKFIYKFPRMILSVVVQDGLKESFKQLHS